jgi:hypothetical protein
MRERGLSIRILLIVLACLTPAVAQAGPKDAGREARRKLFRERFLDHFSLGVQAPVEWMVETRDKNGCRWDCQVEYLSGGAGLPGKPHWLDFGNSPQRSVAAARKAGVVPWFTFYLLAGSAPAQYKGGAGQAAVTNAKVAATMKDYFSLFKTLMEGCAKEAPWPVMVQIEPDEWCHLLLAAGMDPAKVDIKIGSCGLEELKGLPDNLFGYAAALKRLRDQIAPLNVLLGCNPSGWDATGTMSGAKMGLTMKQLAGEWDFAVFETGDKNKGLAGVAPPYGTAIDRTGNLENHLKWIADFHAASGLYVFVWQVASGNTYFSTCNNTPGHYCDNLAQMLLEDYPKNPTVSRYVKSGCIGWMFYAGQDADTRVYDHLKDGITNPPPIPGNLGHKSEHADDDGGYTRLRAGAYYKKPFPILAKPGAKPPPEPPPAAPTPAPAAKAAAPLGTASPDAVAAWDAKLRAAVTEDFQAGRKIRFHLKVVGQPAEATSIDAEGILTFRSDVGNFPTRWKDLALQDRRNMAVARIRESKRAEDLCLAAFFQLACGDEAAGRALLKGVPAADAEEVTAAFKAP